tara:strand:+ start:1750 stop:1989 length:240 start_codon:yes stop_codon:yes gene_type:complete
LLLDIFLKKYCIKPMKPKKSPHDWIAPEHWSSAKTMRRVKIKNSESHKKLYPFGELVIQENAIFQYSRENPPAHISKNA